MKLFAIALTFSLLLVVTLLSLGYRGDRTFEHSGKLPETTDIITNARTLIGTPYDPLMGKYDNIGADFGFIVCSDVPNIAYGLSGYSLKHLLAEDFKKNHEGYDSSNGNNPSNPYFHRRARNIYAYFKSVGRLKPESYEPSAGDLVFYRSTPGGWISHVALVSSVSTDGYKVIESAPKTILALEVDESSPLDRGWILSGFGSFH